MAPGVMWTKEDCDKLNELVERHGKKWTPIASFLGDGKTGKQCRRQWERLNIMTKQCGWSPEEDAMLLEFHSKLGNKWTRISRMIGGRTDNAVKNRYHALRLKRKTKYFTRVDAQGQNTENGLGKRCLRNCSSLEERRAAKEAGMEKSGDGTSLSDAAEGVQFKSEALHKTGYLPNYEGGWTGSHFPSTDSTWTQRDTCKIQQSSSAAPYSGLGIYAQAHAAPEAMNNGQQRTLFLNLASEAGPSIVASSRVSASSNRMAVDDSDSMESTSENKLIAMSTVQSESLPQIYESGAPLNSPFFLGTSSHSLPTRVVDGGHPIEMLSYSAPFSLPESTIPMKKVPDLTLDLTFQQKIDGFDFDSFLHSVSPMSPTAYLKFLNSLSPINRQPSCVSDHDSHMKP